MISEVILPIETSNHDSNYDNNKENKSTTSFTENILDSNFKDCISSLFIINILIKFEVRTSFYYIIIAVYYIE